MVNLARWLPSSLPAIYASKYGKIDAIVPRAACGSRGVVNTWIRGADVGMVRLLKACGKCGEVKPYAEFAPSKRHAEGLKPTCRACVSAVDHDRYLRKSGHRRRYGVPRERIVLTEKLCSRCRLTQFASAFARDRKTLSGLAAYCRACSSEIDRARYLRERGRINEAARQHRREFGEQVRERDRRHYALNPEIKHAASRKFYRKNAELLKQRASQYQRDNPGKKLAVSRNRRAQKSGGGGRISEVEWLALCERYDHRCLACGSRERLTLDHIVPLACGGLHVIDNAQPLCLPCNSQKHTRTIDYRPTLEAKAVP